MHHPTDSRGALAGKKFSSMGNAQIRRPTPWTTIRRTDERVTKSQHVKQEISSAE